jgi:Arc/MetJ family transcription regulator
MEDFDDFDGPLLDREKPDSIIHMKRTNLVLDEQLLEEAVRVLGVKTYSAAVNQALKEAIRVKKAHKLRELFGSGIWEGNLSEMREDRMERLAAAAPGSKR